MQITGDYQKGISVMDRLLARALETKKVADIMDGWLEALSLDAVSYAPAPATGNASGFGLTEAPRGALGRWIDIADGRLSPYHVITPMLGTHRPEITEASGLG
ncbi:MAG: nickel-dependent hydrogenase large subunit [Planctomycetota bacterium]|jgi:hydrogenase large subunit